MDLIDNLIANWARERPELDLVGMQIVGRIMRLGRRFQDEANGLLGQHALTYSEFDLLATLRRSGKPYAQTPSQLQAAVVLSSGGMTACLNRLEKKQLIERCEGVDDRRQRPVRLTIGGLDLVEGLAAARFRLARQQVQLLNPEQRERLISLLKMLIS